MYTQSAFVLVPRSNLRAARVQPPFVSGQPSRPILLHVQASFTLIYRSCCSHHSCFVVLLVQTLFQSKHTSRRSHRLRGNLVAFNPTSQSVWPIQNAAQHSTHLRYVGSVASRTSPRLTALLWLVHPQLRLIIWHGVDHFGAGTVSSLKGRLEHHTGATSSV
jgi:hypothetical protein